MSYEYRAVPAPRKGVAGKETKGGPAKFANAVSILMNEMGAEGWEYLRADTLPCEERQGLTGKTVKYHSMLVFRRPADAKGLAARVEPKLLPPAPQDAPSAVEEAVDLERASESALVQESPVESAVESPVESAVERVEETPRFSLRYRSDRSGA